MEGSGFFNPDGVSQPQCYSALHIANQDVDEVGERLIRDTYTQENITQVVENLPDNESTVYFFPRVLLDTRDEELETMHVYDSEALLALVVLMILSVLTKWAYQQKQLCGCTWAGCYGYYVACVLKLLNETSLMLMYGIIAGLILRYALPSETEHNYYIATVVSEFGTCPETLFFQPREDIHLITQNNGHTFRCEIAGRVFRDDEGNMIRDTLLFDPEIFFFVLLPPIIFYSGYIIDKDNFFRNLGSSLVFAFVGSTLSCIVVGFMMYGYARWGVEAQDSALANATGNPVPVGFENTVVPSFLFGSLISATDPVTVLAIFEHLHVDPRLYSLVFGESVMNDAVAIVLYRAIDEYDTLAVEEEEGESFEVGNVFTAFGIFVGVFVGSFLLGCIVGLTTALLLKFSNLRSNPLFETAVFLMMSYAAFPLAEFVRGSGIVAILFCGITQSHYSYKNLSDKSRKMTKNVLGLLNLVAETVVFLLMGISLFNYSNHQWVPGFILFSFAAILVGRIVNIYGLSFLLNLQAYTPLFYVGYCTKEHIPYRFQHLLAFAGLRGAIAFALAIRNTETTERQLIFTTTLCIVLVTVIVCGGLTVPVLKCLKIKIGVRDEERDNNEFSYNPGWITGKWKWFNKKYLIPIFTYMYEGRPTQEEGCFSSCVPFCTICKSQSNYNTLEEPSQERNSEGVGTVQVEDATPQQREEEHVNIEMAALSPEEIQVNPNNGGEEDDVL